MMADCTTCMYEQIEDNEEDGYDSWCGIGMDEKAVHCSGYKEFKAEPYERNTYCDICEKKNECIANGDLFCINISMDTLIHYTKGIECDCKKCEEMQ